MLNILKYVSQPFEFSLLEILCLDCNPFLIGMFGLLMSSFLSALYILDINSLLDNGLVKIFSSFVGCHFVPVTIVCLTEAFSFIGPSY